MRGNKKKWFRLNWNKNKQQKRKDRKENKEKNDYVMDDDTYVFFISKKVFHHQKNVPILGKNLFFHIYISERNHSLTT